MSIKKELVKIQETSTAIPVNSNPEMRTHLSSVVRFRAALATTTGSTWTDGVAAWFCIFSTIWASLGAVFWSMTGGGLIFSCKLGLSHGWFWVIWVSFEFTGRLFFCWSCSLSISSLRISGAGLIWTFSACLAWSSELEILSLLTIFTFVSSHILRICPHSEQMKLFDLLIIFIGKFILIRNFV